VAKEDAKDVRNLDGGRRKLLSGHPTRTRSDPSMDVAERNSHVGAQRVDVALNMKKVAW
jgi:hypothetical protein